MSEINLLAELARVKAHFQLRTVALHMGVDPNTVTIPSAAPTSGAENEGRAATPTASAPLHLAHPEASQDSLDNNIDVNGFHKGEL